MARKLSDEEKLDAIIAKAQKESEKRDAAVPVTQADVEREAKFLLGWAKSKEISRDYNMTNYFKSGKYMTKVLPKVIDAMMEQGLIIGTKTRFKMNKVAIKALG